MTKKEIPGYGQNNYEDNYQNKIPIGLIYRYLSFVENEIDDYKNVDRNLIKGLCFVLKVYEYVYLYHV